MRRGDLLADRCARNAAAAAGKRALRMHRHGDRTYPAGAGRSCASG